ncbi:hypothetical protein TNCV_1562591 [Trichonephila clavipes]|nr:hypothetical protein TNCV_1562591 [Trichonephila clavipes]
MVTEESRKVFARRNDFVRKADKVSIRRSPDLKRLTYLGSPPIPISALLMANGFWVKQGLYPGTTSLDPYHQGEDPKGKPDTPYLQHYPYISVPSGKPKKGTTSRLTGAGSLLPPVYSEAWAKGIPRTQFSSLRDAAHGKHAGRKTNGVN